ncbi:tyrosine-type recombinase/integrase [Proteinivorax hydrogeniformans]|uniref:Tyrosine-type recombinase/integrase n=1 Tax=Proteinivorax hydrogeniformans TaxID=1826727 RepID=A0AAU8HQ75_9FIRM
MKNAEEVNRYFKEHNLRFSKQTIKTYKFVVNKFFSFYKKDYDKITQKDIENYMLYLNKKGLSPATRAKELIALRSFFNFLLEDELIKKDPTKGIDKPKIPDTYPSYLTDLEVLKLREIVKDTKKRAIIEILYATGVRPSELVNIKHKDINWKQKQIKIPEGKGKKERTVYFREECALWLKKHIKETKEKSEYVFLSDRKSKISKRTVQRYLADYSKELGFLVNPRILRYTFVVHMAQQGAPLEDIRILLGHDDIETTSTYAKLYNEAIKNTYDQFM